MSQWRSLIDLKNQIREDWQTHYSDWTKPGFRAVALHRIGNWRLGLPRPLRFPLWMLYLPAYRWIRNHYGIDLSYTVQLGRRVIIANQGNVAIHPNSRIGDDCVLRQNVTLGAGRSDRWEEAPVLGNSVEVGAGAVIMGGVTIGDGSRIGPNTVILSNVPAGVMVMPGLPRTIPLPKFETVAEGVGK